MQRSSSFVCIVIVCLVSLLPITWVEANSANLSGLSEWDVTSYNVDLMKYQGANGDIQHDQNSWIHLGANHLEGGDVTYFLPIGMLSRTDIVEVWIDGFSSSNALDIGPTVFIGAGKNRYEQISRMSGDAWRPFVFRFADDSIYGDVTDPSNRNENWRIRYPSAKYEVRRIDKSPDELLERQALPIRVSITGAEDFIIKRIEAVVYRTQGSSRRGILQIASVTPYTVYQGNKVSVKLNQSLPNTNVDFYVLDPQGREYRLYPQGASDTQDLVWFYAEGTPFSGSGNYRVKVVDRNNAETPSSDSRSFEYVRPRKIVKATPTPKPVVSKPVPINPGCGIPPCPAVVLPSVPTVPSASIMPVVPSAPVMNYPVPETPIIVPSMQSAQPMAIVPQAPVAASGQYTIQIGAFRTQNSAMALVNTLRSSGYYAYISEAVQSGARILRVRVGQYPAKSLAQQEIAARLQHQGFETWITTLY